MFLPFSFFFNDTATTEIYTLSLHDALPISALDIMLLADLALVILIWIDAGLARPVTVVREPLPALSVGHTGAATYRWTNDSRRPVRLRVREVRPTLLGGIQAPRAVTLPARSTTREDVPVLPVRRGLDRMGADGS